MSTKGMTVDCSHYSECLGKGYRCNSCKHNMGRDYYEPVMEPYHPYVPPIVAPWYPYYNDTGTFVQPCYWTYL